MRRDGMGNALWIADVELEPEALGVAAMPDELSDHDLKLTDPLQEYRGC